MYRNQKLQLLSVLALVLLLSVAMASTFPPRQTEGNIAVIEPDSHYLVLVDDGNNLLNLRFLVGGEVLINDVEATIWDIQPGDRAVVTYENDNNELHATAIHCRRN